MTKYKKILLIQTAFPGDVVLTTPLVNALKKVFPESYLTVMTTPQGVQLLKDSKSIDSLLSYDKKGRDKGLLSFFRLLKDLRKEQFDLCLSPHPSSRTALMAFASSAGTRVGFSHASLSFFYNKKVLRNKDLHEVERILSLLTPLEVDTGGIDKTPALEISPETLAKAEAILNSVGITGGEQIVAVAPGSVWGTKRWTAEGYAALVDVLMKKYGIKVILIGSPAERDTGNTILDLAKNKPVDLIGKTGLSDLVAVIDRCSLLIGNDSAPGHIAAARSVPVVSIFGPTAPSFGYAPYGKNVQIVEKEIPCRPCHHHGPMKCPEGHFRCMRDIRVEDVMFAVDMLLNSRQGS
ncbi:MAG: lipopolysaccharide heptosyltransferase II [bacterium]|nr:lipopolysaccharide heptosyltransferase II [bacterium]